MSELELSGLRPADRAMRRASVAAAATLRDRYLAPPDVGRLVHVRDHAGEVRVVVAHGSEHGWGGGDLDISEWLGARIQSIPGPRWLDAVDRDLPVVQADFARRFGHLEGELCGPSSNVNCLSFADDVVGASWLSRYTTFLVREGSVMSETGPHSLLRSLRVGGRIGEHELRSPGLQDVAVGSMFPPVTGGASRLAEPWRVFPGDDVVIANIGPSDAARVALAEILEQPIDDAARAIVRMVPDYLNVAAVVRF